ncbi:H-NS family nucleoid-associated regulatory protein [Pasteurellaceae bacterium LIM206]|nr:H-NS family nucleoid-associated regulatory protein [Pasteurellaceae bacterium LIM206]
MVELLRTLNNIRNLRAFARDVSLEQLESSLEKLQIVVEEKREEEKAQQAQEIEKQNRIAKYKELLQQDGITAEELVEILGTASPSRKRAPLPAKYKFIDENGNERTWTGQGRTPKALQAQLDAGKSLASFEI